MAERKVLAVCHNGKHHDEGELPRSVPRELQQEHHGLIAVDVVGCVSPFQSARAIQCMSVSSQVSEANADNQDGSKHGNGIPARACLRRANLALSLPVLSMALVNTLKSPWCMVMV